MTEEKQTNVLVDGRGNPLEDGRSIVHKTNCSGNKDRIAPTFGSNVCLECGEFEKVHNG